MRLGATAVLILAILQSAPAQSNLVITAVRLTGTDAVEIAWPADTNYSYRLEQTTNLPTGTWEIVFPSKRATVPANTYGTMTPVAGPVFWRVVSDTADAYFTENGNANGDTLVTLGTTNRDWIAQFGMDGNDTLHVEANAGNDWVEQYGGDGSDYLDAMGGTGNDRVAQFGGSGDDTLHVDGGDGDHHIVVHGQGGNDRTEVYGGGSGAGDVQADGGDGDDSIEMNPTGSTGRCVIRGGAGTDNITYGLSPHETIVVDGGPDGDTLTINSENRSFAVDDTDGNIMYQTGVGGSVITVRNMEHGTVIGNDGNPVYQW